MQKALMHSNRRIATLGLSVSLIVLVLALGMVFWGQFLWLRLMGGVLLVLAVLALLMTWNFHAVPRVALSDTELLVYVRSLRKPFRLPLDVVEVFFMGKEQFRAMSLVIHGSIKAPSLPM